jgi:hypothetical protein
MVNQRPQCERSARDRLAAKRKLSETSGVTGVAEPTVLNVLWVNELIRGDFNDGT